MNSPNVKITRSGMDLLSRLLDRQPLERLGVNGASEVKKHDWFSNVIWHKLTTKFTTVLCLWEHVPVMPLKRAKLDDIIETEQDYEEKQFQNLKDWDYFNPNI